MPPLCCMTWENTAVIFFCMHVCVFVCVCVCVRFVVHGLIPGESYVFRVQAVNIFGLSEESQESSPISVEPALGESSTTFINSSLCVTLNLKKTNKLALKCKQVLQGFKKMLDAYSKLSQFISLINI